MKKIFKSLIILITIFSLSNVYAEVPTGENYSEFATHKVPLLNFLTYATSFNLYGYDFSGHSPSLSSFYTGTNSLVRYEDNTNDNYGVWAIRLLNSYHSVGTYSMSWRVSFNSSSSAGSFCQRIGNISVTGGKVNSKTCSVNSNTAYLLVNYDLTVADTGVSKFDFSGGSGSNYSMSANWFLRLANSVYYPQITVSDKFDTSGLENQNQIIINQNQTTINQNQQIIDEQNKTNKNLDKIDDTINNSDTSSSQEQANNFFKNFQSNDYGLSDIITMPLTLIKSLTNSTCVALQLKVPFLKNNNTLELPCMDTIYKKHFGSFYTIYQTIIFGFIAYWVSVKIYALVKGFKDPDEDKVEVLDL